MSSFGYAPWVEDGKNLGRRLRLEEGEFVREWYCSASGAPYCLAQLGKGWGRSDN